MGINLVVAVTDDEWFNVLRQNTNIKEVNFWAPSGAPFRALVPGELFLFKLHAPRNVIVGGGIFAHATTLPCSLAWESFREANGAGSQMEMRARIVKYRRADPADRSDFVIGCRILTQPFFLEEADWISVPTSWSPNIVSFKTYNTSDPEGLRLWQAVSERLSRGATTDCSLSRYGKPQVVEPRLGQGAFRVLVTEIYQRRCAITQERTLPALDAAHILPYSEGGEHQPSNGILLRRDLHSLFDAGYVTITPDLRFEVSRRIREEFENGRHYYELHGRRIEAPDDASLRPSPVSLAWHNENRFNG